MHPTTWSVFSVWGVQVMDVLLSVSTEISWTLLWSESHVGLLTCHMFLDHHISMQTHLGTIWIRGQRLDAPTVCNTYRDWWISDLVLFEGWYVYASWWNCGFCCSLDHERGSARHQAFWEIPHPWRWGSFLVISWGLQTLLVLIFVNHCVFEDINVGYEVQYLLITIKNT